MIIILFAGENKPNEQSSVSRTRKWGSLVSRGNDITYSMEFEFAFSILDHRHFVKPFFKAILTMRVKLHIFLGNNVRGEEDRLL